MAFDLKPGERLYGIMRVWSTRGTVEILHIRHETDYIGCPMVALRLTGSGCPSGHRGADRSIYEESPVLRRAVDLTLERWHAAGCPRYSGNLDHWETVITADDIQKVRQP